MDHMQASFDSCQAEFRDLFSQFTSLKMRVSDVEDDTNKKVGEILEYNKHQGPSNAQLHFDMKDMANRVNKMDLILNDKIQMIREGLVNANAELISKDVSSLRESAGQLLAGYSDQLQEFFTKQHAELERRQGGTLQDVVAYLRANFDLRRKKAPLDVINEEQEGAYENPGSTAPSALRSVPSNGSGPRSSLALPPYKNPAGHSMASQSTL